MAPNHRDVLKLGLSYGYGSYFTKTSLATEAWVCFPASNEVLMISPFWHFEAPQGEQSYQDPKSISPPGALSSWTQSQHKAQLVNLERPIWKKREETSTGPASHSLGSFMLLWWASHPRPLSELCCHNAASAWPWLLLSWTLTWPSLGPSGSYSHRTRSGPLSGCPHHPQACLACPDGCSGTGLLLLLRALPCLLCCPQSWVTTQGCPSTPETPGLTPSIPQTLLPSPSSSVGSLNSHTYPTPGCKWHPAPFRCSWWHLAGGVGSGPTPTSPAYY